jgi:hypothetical protein
VEEPGAAFATDGRLLVTTTAAGTPTELAVFRYWP